MDYQLTFLIPALYGLCFSSYKSTGYGDIERANAEEAQQNKD
jgi:hypothetical protein